MQAQADAADPLSLSRYEGQPRREKWANKLEFLLSCIGMSVGLGNIWRFPYMAYVNGGAAFLIPYIILMITVGKPMYYLELILGQFQNLGPTAAFNCFPLSKAHWICVAPQCSSLWRCKACVLAYRCFAGLGVCMAYTCFFICLYFNVILAYALIYIAHSLKSPLPWVSCDEKWANDMCFDRNETSCRTVNHRLFDNYVDQVVTANRTVTVTRGDKSISVPYEAYINASYGCTNATQSASEQFFYRNVLSMSKGIEFPGELQWDLTLSLFLSWVFVYVALIKGIKTSGKIVYFTAPAPYFILTVLLIRGVTLPGSMKGIKYFLLPRWEKMFSFVVWQQACQQIFYSLGAAMGTIICLGSFNDFRNDLRIDIMYITAADFFTSLIGGLVVFSVLGNMAHNLDLDISDVAEGGHGLAFVTYPEAASLIAWPNLWALAFFLMLLLLAVDSQFSMFESVLVPFKDEFPLLRLYPSSMALGASAFSFILGLSMATKGGLYVLNLIDTYIGGMILPIIAAFELFTVCWMYGIKRLSLDVEFMLGSPPGLFLKICWGIFCPVSLLVIVVMTFFTQKRTTLGTYTYPFWADVLGLATVLIGLLQIPLFAFFYMRKNNFNVTKCLDPSQDWGPSDKVLFDQYTSFVNSRTSVPSASRRPPLPASQFAGPVPERDKEEAAPSRALESEFPTRDTAGVDETFTPPASSAVGKQQSDGSGGPSQTVSPGTVHGMREEGIETAAAAADKEANNMAAEA